MRVLVSAFDCGPGQGSEAGVGWAWTRAAAQEHEVWVFTRRSHEDSLRKALAEDPNLDITARFIGLRRSLEGRVVQRKLLLTLYYVLWQLVFVRRARAVNRQVAFDVAHHVTFASDSLPAGVAFVGVPFVWGPVGGVTGTPIGLYRWLTWRGRAEQLMRDVVASVVRRTFGDVIAGRASLVVAANRDVAARFRKVERLTVEPNSALTRLPSPTSATRQAASSRRAVFIGRLLPWKGLLLSLHALAAPPAADWVLDVFGDGPEREPARLLVARLGIEDRVRFKGRRPRAEVLEALASADALLFPSFHDSVAWSVAEAESVGCPVVCLDRGGPPLVAGGAGVCVPWRPAASLHSRLAAALSGINGRAAPSTRWDEERLPALLRGWYAIAAGARSSQEKDAVATLSRARSSAD